VSAFVRTFFIVSALSIAAAPVLSGARPVVGHLFEMNKSILGLLERGRDAHDVAYTIRLPGKDLLILTDPDAIEKGIFGASLEPLVGLGLLTAQSTPHRRNRKLVAPAFHHQRIGAYLDVMADYALEAACGWRENAVIDLGAEMMALTLRIVGKTLFDADVATEARRVGDALTYALSFITRRQQNPLSLPLQWPLPTHNRFRAAVGELDTILLDVIAKRRSESADRGDLLSMLLVSRDEDDGSGLSDTQIRDEAMTIFLAGHETTANALSWAIYLLATHPPVWHRLREEVVTALGDRKPGMRDLAALPYTLQIFKETLRLYPPAYFFGREASRDVEVGGLRVPEGMAIGISPYALHRDARLWDAPARFDPDRFEPEREAAQTRFAYLPFGGGPRVCIGNQFALMEGQIILATIAQHVKPELVIDAIEPHPEVTLRPRDGVIAKIKRL
jgi:cytochrome P450